MYGGLVENFRKGRKPDVEDDGSIKKSVRTNETSQLESSSV